MKILKRVVLVVLLIPILLVLVSLFLPSNYHVERSVVIKAPPEVIFPYLNQLKRWPEWTAWTTNREPTLAYTYSSSSEGAGAVQTWTSKSGNGTITLTASDPKTGVKYELNFDQGKFVSTGGIALAPTEGGTRLTWFNEGNLGWNPVARYLGLMMDKMMGRDFEEGLHNLQQKLETKGN